jgi:DNA-binding NtrC family response regulator
MQFTDRIVGLIGVDEPIRTVIAREMAADAVTLRVVSPVVDSGTIPVLKSCCAVVCGWPDPRRGVSFARRFGARLNRVPVILIAAKRSQDTLLAAMRAGVSDYLCYPLSAANLRASILAALPPSPRTVDPSNLRDAQCIVGTSEALQTIKSRLGDVARSEANVLVTGDTGTGKELIADLIHRNSPRCGRSFVRINCAAIPETLIESELFGYESGAFTGANTARQGKLEIANGGTVFLDEIGEMSALTQAKILRAIEGKEIQRLGSSSGSRVDVRIVAATNLDVETLVADGRFRKDLFFRLNVARIHVPPLAARREDIGEICQHYIEQMNECLGLDVRGFTEDVLRCLLAYDWPGNVRELRNLIEATFIHRPTGWITVDDLPDHYRKRLQSAVAPDERSRVLAALCATNWNKSEAAKKLQWSRMTLYRKIAKYRIQEGGRVVRRAPDNPAEKVSQE